MKAWMLDEPGKPLALREVSTPQPRRGAVLLRMEAVPLLSYTRAYLEGRLPYAFPPGPFSPGTNGVGRIVAVGEGVYGFRSGQRVAVNPYWRADETVAEPEQVLIGLTGISTASAPMLGDFPHGTLRELAEFPASTIVALDGLDAIPSSRLAALGKFSVPFGGLRRGRARGALARCESGRCAGPSGRSVEQSGRARCRAREAGRPHGRGCARRCCDP